MASPVTFEQFLDIVKDLVRAWYYFVVPAMIYLYIKINKKLRKIERKTNFLFN